MMNALIVDDENTNTQLVSNLLELFCPEVKVLGTANSLLDAYQQITELKPDLVFLDVELGDGTGFDLLECFEKIDFKVIFISAHLKYAIDAFKISAIDYILKPVSPASMINAVKKAQKAINFEELNEQVQKLLSEIALSSPEKKILLKTSKRIYKVKVGDIVRMESDGSYTTVFLSNGHKILVSKPIKDFESLPVLAHLVRVHQSHMVNLDFVFYFERTDNVLRMKDESVVPVAVRKREYILSLISEI